MSAETAVKPAGTLIDSKTGRVIDEPPAPVSLGDIAAKHLNNVGEGALIERVGKLMREGVRHIVEEEADKATVTITLTISKDKRDTQLFVTEGKAKLATPIPAYSSATFITKDGEPSNDRKKDAVHHSKQTGAKKK